VQLDFTQYMPHGMCLLWEPWLLFLWGGSDFLIFAAYSAIPLALMRVVWRRDDLNHRGLVILFAAFILLCGVTHALSVVTLWVPIYPVQGVIKLATGLVSAATAIVLFRMVPMLVAIPSATALTTANRRLREEIAAHEATLADLRRVQAELEDKVADRTSALSAANERLAVTAREAVHRSGNLISVAASLARQSARNARDLDEFIRSFLGRLDALAAAPRAILQTRGRNSADLGDVVRGQLEPILLTYGDRVRIDGPHVETGSEAAQQIALALHELATNAQKHGALSGEDHGVRLHWDVDTERLLLT